MKLEQLEQLVLIDKYGSVSKAAREIYMSPSTLSNNLSSLEEEIGIRLFERSPKGVTPTAEGKDILQHAYVILKECEQILNYEKLQHDLTGEITVLFSPAYKSLFSKLILTFESMYPDAVLHLKTCLPEQIHELLAQGVASFGVALATREFLEYDEYLDTIGLKRELFQKNNIKFLVGKNHVLADKEDITLSDIARERFIVHSEYYWALMKPYMDEHQKVTIVEDFESILQLIANGEGVSYLPESMVRNNWQYQQKNVIALDDLTDAGIDMLLYSSKRKLTLLEKNVLELLRQMLFANLSNNKVEVQ